MTITEKFQAVRLGLGNCDGRRVLVKMSAIKIIVNIQPIYFC